MTLHHRTFRIFVSSTFSDLKAERNALQEQVFPRLRALCMAQGCRFQAIDLRWGVSEEAALDQQTLTLCLREIERCQRLTPRPNFIILLGDRYGWRPLPARIEAAEFEALLERLNVGERDRLLGWYRRDDNAVPPEYGLLPRQGEFVDADSWAREETALRAILRRAVDQVLPPGDARRIPYEASATHQEILRGALGVADAREHVFGFLRTIQDLPPDPSAREFIDLDRDGHLDGEAQTLQRHLKNTLRQTLPGHVYEYEARWTGAGSSTDHLAPLCEDVYAALAGVIEQQAATFTVVDPLEQEVRDHADFGRERATGFLGRTQSLAAIRDYCQGQDRHPLAIIGASGAGKTALLARAVEQLRQDDPAAVILYRFIGATPAASAGWALLESVCQQLARIFQFEEQKQRRLDEISGVADEKERQKQRQQIEEEYAIPSDFQKLAAIFPRFITFIPPTAKLILVLDALDQLADTDNARYLSWLPTELPEPVKLIVSTLPGPCAEVLVRRLPEPNRLNLEPLSRDEGGSLLAGWLREAGRTLQPSQQHQVLSSFARNGLPLYLKLAFEEARHWQSYDPERALSPDIPGMIGALFSRLSRPQNHGEVLVARSLGYLAAAKNGLTEDELLEVLSADATVMADFQRRAPRSPQSERLPVVIWSRLWFELEPYLSERSADGTTLLGFYHRQLLEEVTERYLVGEHELHRHAALADYFQAQVLEVEQAGNSIPNLRKLSELPYQQAFAGLADELTATLTDFSFLSAKVAAAGPQPLIEDYDLVRLPSVAEGMNEPATRRQSLQWIQEALQLSAHILSQDGKQLCSQLYGRLLPFDEPEITALREQIRRWKKPWLRPLTASFTPAGGPLVRTLIDPTGHVIAVAVTADGRTAVSGSWDGTVKVWDLARGAERATLAGHTGEVLAVAVTADGRTAVSGSYNYILKVWDLARGTERGTLLTGHTGYVTAVAVTTDGRTAVSGSADHTLKVWDLERGAERFTLRGHTGDVTAAAVTTDGRTAVSGSWDGTVKVWDLDRGAERATLFGPTTDWSRPAMVTAVAVTADGRTAVSGSEGTLRVWDLDRGTERATLIDPTGRVMAVAVTADGRTAVSGSADHTLKVWDLERGAERFTLRGHTGDVTAAAVTTDGRTAVSGSWDGTVKVWDLDRGAERATLFGPTTDWSRPAVVTAVAVTADGRTAVSGSADGTVKVWDLDRGAERATLTSHTDGAIVLAVTADGRTAVSGSANNTLKVWDLDRGTERATLIGPIGRVMALAVTADGRTAVSGSADGTVKVWDLNRGAERATAVSGSWDGTVKVWDLDRGAERATLIDPTGCVMAVAVTAVAVRADGRTAVSGSADGTLKVWDLDRGAERATLTSHTDGAMILAVTADGRTAVSGSEGTLRVWNLDRGAERATLIDPTGRVMAVAVTADGRTAVSGSGGTLRVWNLDRGTERATLTGHTGRVFAVAVTADGRTAVSGSWDAVKVWDLDRGAERTTLTGPIGTALAVTADGRAVLWRAVLWLGPTLKVWDLARGTERATLTGPTGLVMALAVTADGRTAVSRSRGDCTLKVWDLDRGAERTTLRGHTGDVTAVAVTADGRTAVSGSEDDTLGVWNLDRGTERATLRGHTSGVMAVAVTADGRTAVSGSEDDTLKIWDLDRGAERATLRGHTSGVMAVAVTADGCTAVSGSVDGLRVWDLAQGRLITRFSSEGEICTCAIAPDGLTVVAGDASGRVHFIKLENVTPGPPILTAWHSLEQANYLLGLFKRTMTRLIKAWHSREQGDYAFGCTHCRTWSEISVSALGTELPCPHCGKTVKLNPFTVEADWRPVAAAWSERTHQSLKHPLSSLISVAQKSLLYSMRYIGIFYAIAKTMLIEIQWLTKK